MADDLGLETLARARFDEAVAELERRVDEVTDAELTRLFASPDVPGGFLAAERQATRETVRAALSREIKCFQAQELPSEIPAEDLTGVRAAHAHGAPLTLMLACYRAGQAALTAAWEDIVAGLELDGDATRELTRLGREFFFDYTDRLAALVEREYLSARANSHASRDLDKIEAVRAALEGEPDARALGYAMERNHLALVASGEEADDALREFSGTVREPMLSVSPQPNRWWAWLGCASETLPAALAARLGALAERYRVYLAAAGPTFGLEGFKLAHEHARAAHRIGEPAGRALTVYEDVALELAFLQKPARARLFVERELGELAGPGERADQLRATLVAYFATGHNAASAGAKLGVHERTVTNRLRAIEDRLGRPVTQRRAELEAALRLFELLPAVDPH